MCACVHVSVTVFEDADEQGLVSLRVPPVSWDLSVERLRDPDIQHAEEQRRQHIIISLSY